MSLWNVFKDWVEIDWIFGQIDWIFGQIGAEMGK